MLMPTEMMLREAAEDVAHEMFLFYAAFDHLFVSERRAPSRFVWQGWYVLARNLMDFFDTTRVELGDADDVVAGDFFDPPLTWQGLRELVGLPTGYKNYEVAAHKRAAHLTYSRARYRRESLEPHNPSTEVSNHLLVVSSLFLKSLVPERQEWFRDAERENFHLPWDIGNPA
jgi:hypothetical protein